MTLQVRLRHPLGDRLIELTPRPAQQPVVVGRMAGAEVQVPSVAVAPRHSMLFVHQGRWAIQDASGTNGSGTYVNGKRIAAATFLKVGDLVTLGADAKAASIEIDPDGAAEGRSGYAVADAAAVAAPAAPVQRPRAAQAPIAQPRVPQPRVAAPPQPARAVGRAPASAVPPQPRAMPQYAAPVPPQPAAGYGHPPQPAYAPQQQPVYAQAQMATPVAAPGDAWGGGEQQSSDELAWQAATTAARHAPRRLPRKSNAGAIVLACLAMVCGVGAIIYYVAFWKAKNTPVAATQPTTRKTVAPAPVATAPVAKTVEPASNNAFGIPNRPAPLPGGTATGGSPAANAGPSRVSANATEVGGTAGVGRKASSTLTAANTRAGLANAGPAAGASDVSPGDEAAEVLAAKNDERMKSQEWRNITTAYYARNPLDALMRMDAYEKLHPGVLTAQIAKLRDGVLDKLWWERIDQLWRKREELAKRLAEVDQSLVEETNETYKQSTIIPEKMELTKQINAVNDVLEREMGFTADKPPVLTDDNDLNRLRRFRDPDFYAKWKSNVVSSVHRSRALPFDWDR